MGVTSIIVTRTVAFVGMRVARGPEWAYGTQDHKDGKPVPGTIKDITSDAMYVVWDNGVGYHYCYFGSRDLYFYEDDPPVKKNTTRAPRVDSSRTDVLIRRDQVRAGDKVMCVNKDYYYAEEEELVMGDIYTIRRANTGTYEEILLENSKKGYYVGLSNFVMYEKKNTKDVPCISPREAGETILKLVADGDVEVGDKVKCINLEHYYALEAALEIGQVYKVRIKDNSGSIMVEDLKGKCNSYWVGISNFAMYEKATAAKPPASHSSSEPPIRYESGAIDWNRSKHLLYPSQKLRCIAMGPITESYGIRVGDIVEVGEVKGLDFIPKNPPKETKDDIKYVSSSNYTLVSDVAGSTAPAPPAVKAEEPVKSDYPTLRSDGVTYDWSKCAHLVVVGARLKCIYSGGTNIRTNGIEVGDIIEVGAVSGFNVIRPKGKTYWVNTWDFVPAQSQPINMSSIYSQIKQNKDESESRNTDPRNRSIQVQRAAPAIRRTERVAGCGFRCGRSKATIAK